MKISETIQRLEKIKAEFGDISIIGGYMSDDTILTSILVVNEDGMEVFPKKEGNPNSPIDGVFLT